MAEILERGRPAMTPPQQAVLARHLESLDPGWPPRPSQLHRLVYGYLALSAFLIGLAAVIGLGII